MSGALTQQFETADAQSPDEGPVRIELVYGLFRMHEKMGSDCLGRETLAVFDPATMTLPDMVGQMQDAVIKKHHAVLGQEMPPKTASTRWYSPFVSNYDYEVHGDIGDIDYLKRYGTVAVIDTPFKNMDTDQQICTQIARNLTVEPANSLEKLFATTFGQFFKGAEAPQPKEGMKPT